jgi:hypothetical protein
MIAQTLEALGKDRKDEEESNLELSDGLDEILVDGNEIRAILVVDNDVGQADKEPLFFIDGIRDTVSHGRNQKIAHIHAVDRSDANANLLPFGHRSLLRIS